MEALFPPRDGTCGQAFGCGLLITFSILRPSVRGEGLGKKGENLKLGVDGGG